MLHSFKDYLEECGMAGEHQGWREILYGNIKGAGDG